MRISNNVINHMFLAVRESNHLLSEEFLAECNKTSRSSHIYHAEDIETELVELGIAFAKKRISRDNTNLLQWMIILELATTYQGGNNPALLAFFNKYDSRYF